MSNFSDRHRPRKRKYPSGSQKTRLAEEKRESMLLAASSTRKMTDFFQSHSGSSSYDENSQMPSQNSIGSQGSQESSLSMTGISETEPDTSKGAESADSEIDPEVNKSVDPEIDPEVNKSSDPEIEPVASIRPEQGVDNDIGLWPTRINDELVDYWVRRGPKELQRNEGAFSASVLAISDGSKRSCTSDMFVKTLRNQETIARTWLCYSSKVGKTYCFYCKLSNASGTFNTGFNDWAHA